MGITEILRKIWLFSANKIKSSESFSKQPTQLIIAAHNCHIWMFFLVTFRKSAIIEVLPPPAADPIAGRYRLLKTENFDEFMKRLGVGLIKRKLANSVSPQNVIIINDDGKYQIHIHCKYFL